MIDSAIQLSGFESPYFVINQNVTIVRRANSSISRETVVCMTKKT